MQSTGVKTTIFVALFTYLIIYEEKNHILYKEYEDTKV